MCGIVGFSSQLLDTAQKKTTIKSMLRMIVHRGPDEQGYLVTDSVAIGAARLSILDISQGTQPICDQSGRFWITYNGEVYNYVELRKELQEKGVAFSTTCDTEVVLAAFIHWGTDAFKKFNGGYAFCIHDTVSSKMYLVRDRMGKRPLFYSLKKQQFLYSSEIKAFLRFPNFGLNLNVESLHRIFSDWVPGLDQTCFADIKQLRPGHFIEFDIPSSTLQEKMYYELNLKSTQEKMSAEEASEELESVLKKSIDLRLRSDVEVAVYLSGGLDSSITTSLASERIGDRLNAFSIQFDNGGFDESESQRLLVDHLGINHSFIRISDSDLMNNFEEALYHTEVPQFRSAFVPMFLLSKLVAKNNIKVVLTGEGADEFFLGYDIFKEADMLDQWPALEANEKLNKLRQLYPYMDGFKNNSARLASRYNEIQSRLWTGSLPHLMRNQTASFSKKLISRHIGDETFDSIPYPDGYSAVQITQHAEIQSLLQGYLLSSQGDRMAMSHGVENRLPFLDPEVIAFANRLPQDLRLSKNWEEKHVLRSAFANRLPEAISKRQKNPYLAPDSVAFLKNTSNLPKNILSFEDLKSREWLDHGFAQKFIKKMVSSPTERISPRENHAFMLLISTIMVEDLFIRGGWRQYESKREMNFTREVVLC